MAILTPAKIDEKINTDTLAVMTVRTGGVAIGTMSEAAEYAKTMAISAQCVPPHCRNAPGVCLAIVVQAAEWGMNPFAVANKSYIVNDRVAYESQLIHAVIEQRAPLTKRLRPVYSGEGASRTCKIVGHVRGEDEPFEYTSPPIAKITPQNSPLWKTKPDIQLFYNASRDWARMYFPDVIMGVYAEDELPSGPPQQAERRKIADLVPREPAARVEQLVPALECVVEHVPPVETASLAVTEERIRDATLSELDALGEALMLSVESGETTQERADALMELINARAAALEKAAA